MRNDYDTQTQNSGFNQLVLQEEFILEVTEALSRALAESGMNQSKLAQKLGCTRGFVSQVFTGGRNLTLRTVSDMAAALGVKPRFLMEPLKEQIDYAVGSIDVSQYAKRSPKIVLRASAFSQPESEPELRVA